MKRLRRKIVLGVFMSATLVFLLTVLLAGVSLNLIVTSQADTMTELIVQAEGKLPVLVDPGEHGGSKLFNEKEFGKETFYRLRYFTVKYEDGEAKTDLANIASISYDEAVSLADTVRSDGKTQGYIEVYRYRVSDDWNLIVFLDNSDDVYTMQLMTLALLVISMFVILMITLVFWVLSKRIVKPFEENARMQKQFITDASHELKTPLAIISANAEVLAYKDGENEWIGNITSQVARVSELVNELLTLNRLEEVEEISDIEPVNLSQITNKVADSFTEVFNGKNVSQFRDIQPDVIINGNPSLLERLISVLTENASKYVAENGEVRITLKKDTRYTRLTVFNTCKLDSDADYTHLFDRFYRPDSSRTSKTGGHGVGLSIAKRIVTLHNGSIEAVPSGNGLSFNVKLSNKLKLKKKK